MCYDASVLSFDATSPTDFHQGAVPLYIQCAFARNVMPYFSYPKAIYIVSWCDCSSVGGSTRHLSVPGTPQRGCRRLHQILGQGKQPHTGERGGGWERVWGHKKRVWAVLRLIVQPSVWERREVSEWRAVANSGEGDMSDRDVDRRTKYEEKVRKGSHSAQVLFYTQVKPHCRDDKAG